MLYAAFPSFFGLGLEDSHVPNFLREGSFDESMEVHAQGAARVRIKPCLKVCVP